MYKFIFSIWIACTVMACDIVPIAGYSRLPNDADMLAFTNVIERVVPVGEKWCRREARVSNCDFDILIAPEAGRYANAFQKQNEKGQPEIIFTPGMITLQRNADELAFVLAHEMAHHILDHLGRVNVLIDTKEDKYEQLAGQDGIPLDKQVARSVGAILALNSYSKDFELEADVLGARILQAAGYDPLIGAQFFNRIPDPKNEFLTSHPPNSERYMTVYKAIGP